jgi:carboxylate-amine ligase
VDFRFQILDCRSVGGFCADPGHPASGNPKSKIQNREGVAMPDFTIGIEEEFQIIDPETRELRSHITEMIEGGRIVLGEQVKPEMHQSMIEVGTTICNNVQEARVEVIKLRRAVAELALANGMRIAAASTHAISSW